MGKQKIVGKEIKDYPRKSFAFAAVAIDVVLFRLWKNKLQVMLLQLDEEPFKGKWALPGGLVTKRENLKKAALRHLKNKINLNDEIFLEQLYSFGNPKRDPLGWVVSIAYLGLLNKKVTHLKAAKRYRQSKWHDVSRLPSLAYDHDEIVKTGANRLISKVGYTNIIQFLVKEEFTLSQLQKSYEAVLNQSLDKRNFRKKLLNLNLIKPLNKARQKGSKRPAMLYQFRSNKLKITAA